MVTRQDEALALNSLSETDINFINVNAMDNGAAMTVTVGEKISIKCGGFGNGAPVWTWDLTKQYTELITANSVGLNDGYWSDGTPHTQTLTGYVFIVTQKSPVYSIHTLKKSIGLSIYQSFTVL